MRRHNFTYLLIGLLLFALIAPTTGEGVGHVRNVFWMAGFTTILVVGFWSLAANRVLFLIGGGLALASVILRLRKGVRTLFLGGRQDVV